MLNRTALCAASALSVIAVAGPVGTGAQEVAPFFEQAGTVLYETYTGVEAPKFVEYFEGLVEKYRGADAAPWGTYRENAKVWYRITPLADGWESLAEVNAARNAGAQQFTDAERQLWSTAWATRHAALYAAAPNLSVVPAGFTVADIQALPYHRVFIYRLKWDQAPAFRQALAARSALDREANIDDFVFTAWNGGLGTEAQTVMVRVSAASRAADAGPNQQARRKARESYRDEWVRLTQIMDGAASHVERHDQQRVSDLSYAPSR